MEAEDCESWVVCLLQEILRCVVTIDQVRVENVEFIALIQKRNGTDSRTK